MRNRPYSGDRTDGHCAGDPVVDVPLGSLSQDPRNLRIHDERNLEMVELSLATVGAARSIVIDENGVILAGNATVLAGQRAGIERVRVVDTDGTEIVAVRRRNLTPEQKQLLSGFDNRCAELGRWDVAGLQNNVLEGVDLALLFDTTELEDLLSTDAPVPDFQPIDATARLDELQPHCRTCTCRAARTS